MADYVSIIAKAVLALAENNAESRGVIYQKARDTIDRKLRAMNPPPPETAIAAQMQQLEAAIQQVEVNELASASEAAAGVSADTPVAVEEVPVSTPPQEEIASVLPEAADTPILIDGIGDKTVQHLAEEGVTKASQIATMPDGELAALTEKLGIPGFEKTQEWKEHASALLAGNPPRSKTDQERMRKMLEEAGATPEKPQQVKEASAVELPVTEEVQQEPVAPEPEDETVSAQQVSPAPIEAKPVSPEPVQPPEPVVVLDVSAAPEEPVAPVSNGEVAAPATVSSTPEAVLVPEPVATQQEAPVITGDGEAATAGQPKYVSELENDPMVDRTPPVSRPVPPPRRRGAGRTIGWLLTILLVGAAGAGAYYYQDEVKETGGKAINAVSAMIEEFTGDKRDAAAPSSEEQAAEPEAPEKDTARLGNNGETQTGDNGATGEPESNEGAPEQTEVRDVTPQETEQTPVVEADEPVQLVEPADGAASTEENSAAQAEAENAQAEEESVQTEEETGQQPTEEQPAASEPTQQPVVLAGEKAFLYEEGFGTNGASRDDGAVSWTLSQEPPEEGAEPEPVIKGVMDVPARGLQLNMTIKRNVDAALPASHIIELFFTVPPGFSGGNIDQISRFVMKSTEQARGESLVGVPARIDAGYFLIALNNLEQAQQTNLGLLETANWIDVPITYLTGRRGLVTLEKGATGKKIFSNAMADWRNR